MSPTIEALEGKIGRLVEKRDVLQQSLEGISDRDDFDYRLEEVVDPNVLEDPNRAAPERRGEKPAVKVRELTFAGPASTEGVVERNEDFYIDIVKWENRIDMSKLEKLRLRLRKVFRK
jgi:hypothetical protein